MPAAIVLDVLLVLLLLAYLVVGWRGGFARTLGALVGIVLGATVAFLAVPFLARLVPAPEWRLVAAIAAAVLLVGGGHALGAAAGRALRPSKRLKPLRAIDRVLGAALGVVAAALASSLVLGSVGALGAPLLTLAVQSSTVLRTIDGATPRPVAEALSRVRSAVLQDGIPSIAQSLGGVAESPGAPPAASGDPRLAAAADSVVRIGGTAYACGQSQSGTGFAVADDRIVTNAHVVAGVAAPIVQAPDGTAREGRVVYFDPVDDLAVIATEGLGVAPLDLAEALGVGDRGVVDGYPYGGPYTRGGAEVLAVSTELVDDITRTSSSPRSVYTLAAVVEPGNSGGPLLTLDGRVAGVVFAESSNDPELGYAMTNAELQPVADAAARHDAAGEPGGCVRG
jgi:S1-C subfamily serine protease